ncbi:hypothetical protein JCM14244_13650 [Venenivibrio stagnispumantis]|uniref:N-ATPase, AtpR subunit n=1 Tax=Venenivibrio stagnispumantis TaxID=407998 RepID=A0AA45WKU8_9AQUI|nr:N-ATPase, AtpR subunit [Venenivibrio stagnispumantis]
MTFVFLFFLGFITGVFYFLHLYNSVKKAILKRKNKLKFFERFLVFAVISIFVAYLFKIGIIAFLIGFYISRVLIQYKNLV